MLRRFKAFEAPDHYEFKDPDTGYVMKGPTIVTVINQINQYRAQNGLEILEQLPAVIEEYTCGLPENCNKCQPNTDLHRSIFLYVKGGVQLAKNALFRNFVTQAQAETRGQQCLGCRHNVFPDKTGFPAWADNVAVMQVGDRKVSMEKDLGNCEVCTCLLKSKVFQGGPLPKFPEDQVEKLRDVKCWQLKESNQE